MQENKSNDSEEVDGSRIVKITGVDNNHVYVMLDNNELCKIPLSEVLRALSEFGFIAKSDRRNRPKHMAIHRCHWRM